MYIVYKENYSCTPSKCEYVGNTILGIFKYKGNLINFLKKNYGMSVVYLPTNIGECKNFNVFKICLIPNDF